MANFVEKYSQLFDQLADPRVKDWAGVSSHVFAVAFITVYLLAIYVLLPTFMKNRKPYSLKTFLYCYNVFQIGYCLALMYSLIAAGCTWRCEPVDYSTNQRALAMLTGIYYALILKMIEFAETAVFVLRKKSNQVSGLHVYHHVSTFLLAWISTKYAGGGMIAFPIVMNSGIHVLMYTYYLLASMGPKWQRKTVQWKSKLTMLQMVQFCVLIVHSLQSLQPGCKAPKELLMIYLPDVCVMFYMFYEFYKKNYKTKIV